jgi:hypothetical protein
MMLDYQTQWSDYARVIRNLAKFTMSDNIKRDMILVARVYEQCASDLEGCLVISQADYDAVKNMLEKEKGK